MGGCLSHLAAMFRPAEERFHLLKPPSAEDVAAEGQRWAHIEVAMNDALDLLQKAADRQRACVAEIRSLRRQTENALTKSHLGVKRFELIGARTDMLRYQALYVKMGASLARLKAQAGARDFVGRQTHFAALIGGTRPDETALFNRASDSLEDAVTDLEDSTAEVVDALGAGDGESQNLSGMDLDDLLTLCDEGAAPAPPRPAPLAALSPPVPPPQPQPQPLPAQPQPLPAQPLPAPAPVARAPPPSRLVDIV